MKINDIHIKIFRAGSGDCILLEVTVQHPVKGTLIFGQNRENKISVSSLL